MNKRNPELDRSFRALENNRAKSPVIMGRLEAWEYTYPDTKPSTIYVLTLNPSFEAPKQLEKAKFVLDDGEKLEVYYVAGWSTPDTPPHKEWRLYLYPVTPGTTRWTGPAKTYFLSVKPRKNESE